jgi:hypothetical protein
LTISYQTGKDDRTPEKGRQASDEPANHNTLKPPTRSTHGTLPIGCSRWVSGLGFWDLGLGTWDLGLGTWDLGLGTWDLGLGTWDLGLGF